MRLSTGMVWDVLPAFQLRDERMRGAGALGDLLLGQIQLASLVSHENEPSGPRLQEVDIIGRLDLISDYGAFAQHRYSW
jgi:hypothetical protein